MQPVWAVPGRAYGLPGPCRPQIWMPFRVVSGVQVGRGMGALDGVEIVEGRGSFRGKCGTSHCNQHLRTLLHS